MRTLTARDGTWLLAEAFSPYGTSLGRDTASGGVGVALRYRWTGREYDAETGFYYLRARYYSPELRRFMQEDPAGAAGGANAYAYVEGSPLEASDPSGLRPSPDGAYMSWQRSLYGGASPACESGCGDGRAMTDPTAWNWGVGVLDEWAPRDFIVPAPTITAATMSATIHAATDGCCVGIPVPVGAAAGVWTGIRALGGVLVNAVAVISTVFIATDERYDPVMVRLQAQGAGLLMSVTIASGVSGVITSGDGLTALNQLAAGLTARELAVRSVGFQQATRFIVNAGAGGGVYPMGSKSFPPYSAVRVDIEVIRGRAFTPGVRSDAVIR